MRAGLVVEDNFGSKVDFGCVAVVTALLGRLPDWYGCTVVYGDRHRRAYVRLVTRYVALPKSCRRKLSLLSFRLPTDRNTQKNRE
jgi:hypothetical protein